jgi:hypothetical protein
MFRISEAAMDTSLERIRAKIIELEAKIADTRLSITSLPAPAPSMAESVSRERRQ